MKITIAVVVVAAAAATTTTDACQVYFSAVVWVTGKTFTLKAIWEIR